MKRSYTQALTLLAVVALFLVVFRIAEGRKTPVLRTIPADNPNIQYTGRIDFSNPKLPRFWASGVYIRAKFRGSSCVAVINDEVLWGKSHNYIEVVIDENKPFRIQTTGKTNTFTLATGLSSGEHTVTLCKDTEAAIGYLEFVGFQCEELVPLPRKSKHKLEFIGDSITCGAESDLSTTPCGKGEWYDRHNAYLSYGAITARQLNAQWHLTSRSGIGLMHSCCDMKEIMPEVWDKFDVQKSTRVWDTKRYQPDALMVCLGQNDGEQDPTAFRTNYLQFLQKLREAYPKTQIVCLSSPMGSPSLQKYQHENLAEIVNARHRSGDKKVSQFLFSRSYNSGCGGHPDVAEHQRIADELTAYLKTTLKW